MKFENQDYQEECVNNIINILDKSNFNTDNFSIKDGIENFYKNNTKLTNFKEFIKERDNIDILMETGTGKTFVYLKTILEINKKYNINKFIIFIPRNAIRESVIQNIKLTRDFFYSNDNYKKYINYYTYNGDTQTVGTFINRKDELSVLILTTQSISSEDKNLLRKVGQSDRLSIGESWLSKLVKLNPIIIFDEPHLLEGESFKKAVSEFKNSLFIRFGATFPNKKNSNILNNVAYSLDSITSFQKYLVKRISVNTVGTSNNDFTINKIDSDGRNKRVEITWYLNGIIQKKNLQKGDDIGIKTGLEQYNNISIQNIKSDKILLSNGSEKNIKNDYILSDIELTNMIKRTIEIHFEKEETLFKKNIKELSLFFIPNVNDFRGDNPKIKNIFEKLYIEIRKKYYDKTTNEEYKKYLDKDFDENGKLKVDEGYFSGDKGSKENKDEEGINQILKDKEKLLSFDSPLKFIFSVWALQEGWDNPNVFNICKLTNQSSEISKRQQIGRGLRICVNQDGYRQTYNYLKENESEFFEINTLDMIVSDYEKYFIQGIQKEIIDNSYCIAGNIFDENVLEKLNFNQEEIRKTKNVLADNDIIKFNETTNEYEFNKQLDYVTFIRENKDKLFFLDKEKYNSLIKNYVDINKYIKEHNNEKIKVKIRKENLEKFKDLWENINRKVRIFYKDIQEDIIINEIIKKFNNIEIEPIKIFYTKEIYDAKQNEIIKEKEEEIGAVNFFKNNDYLNFIQYFIEQFSLNFTLKIFNKIDLEKIKNNPEMAKKELENIIINEIHSNIINKISYEINDVIIDGTLRDENGNYKDEIEYEKLGINIDNENKTKENYLYDKIVYDSTIEKDIIKNDFNNYGENKIIVFAKLPKISIPTPYKLYSPDFAYLIERKNKKTLFLIVESKGYNLESDIPEQERKKIEYAEKFFKKLQEKLPNIEIKFKKRINKEQLSKLINN